MVNALSLFAWMISNHWFRFNNKYFGSLCWNWCAFRNCGELLRIFMERKWTLICGQDKKKESVVYIPKICINFQCTFFHIYRPWHTQSYFICIFWWVFAMIFERYRKNGIRHKKRHKLEKKVRCRLWKVDLYVNKFEYNLFGLNREAANIVIGHTAESSNWAWWFNI